MTEQQSKPRPAKKRRLSVRLPDGGHRLICDRASAADITPSHMVRRMLAYATQQMPASYAPARTGTQAKSRKLSVRVSDGGHRLICDRAATVDVTPSHMVRRMLTYAAAHMPAGYLPGRARAQVPAVASPSAGGSRRSR